LSRSERRGPSRLPDERPPSDLVPLVARLLELAAKIAPVSQELRTNVFHDQIDTYRNALTNASSLAEAQRLTSESVALCEDFFGRSQHYHLEREQELRELIAVLQEALATLSGDSDRYHGSLMQTSARLSRLAGLDDLRTLKSQLTKEVEALKRTVEEQRKKDREQFGALSKRVVTLETRLQHSQQEASMDSVTEIPNRRSFDTSVVEWTTRHQKSGKTFALAMVDIDDFKKINDQHGHQVGDRVLKCAAQAISGGVRKSDFVARYGGEEFVVMLSDATLKEGRERMNVLVETIAAARYKYRQLGEEKWVNFTVSVGVTEFGKGDDPQSLVARADEALYEAKRRGKNTVRVRKKKRLGLFG
jgi:diguanylate cyclase